MGEYMKEDGFDFDNVIFKMRKQDWEHYDWGNVEDNLDQISGELSDDVSVEEREKLLGITQEEVLDFADWLNDHDPMYLMRAQVYQVLIEKGLSDEEAEFLVRDLNLLQKSIETAEALGLIDLDGLDGQDEEE